MIKGQSTQLQRDSQSTLLTTGAMLLMFGFLLSCWSPDSMASTYRTVALFLAAAVAVSIGSGRLRRRLRVADALADRLKAFGQTSTQESLTPIFDKGTIGTGWNRLVEHLHNQRLDQGVERRLADSAGTGSSERFARALRSISEGLAITDRHGKLNYVNPACVSLISRHAEADNPLVGESLTAVLEANGYHNWQTVSHQLLEGTRPIRLELRLGATTADGILQLSRLPLEGRVHEIEGYVWTFRNVTQSVLASEAHEHFLASATHELRTPLTNIKAYSESLIDLENIPRSKQKEFFNIIHTEAERLSRLLNQLLDIQQLQTGSMTINAATFDVQRMVQEIQTHIQPLVEDKQLKLSCRIAPDIKSILADKEKIISCLINLLGNAIKYTPAGGEIRLCAEQLETAVAISVEDTGIGIAAEELPKIFERFYRCQDDRVGEIEGNGLGLAFAMEVAKLHQGELKVESQLNKGSRFTLRLPVVNE